MSSKKVSTTGSSRYAITRSANFSSKSNPKYLATLSSNFLGTEYTLTSNLEPSNPKDNPELLAITYENNLFKPNSGPRKLTIGVPSVYKRAPYASAALLNSAKANSSLALGVEVHENKMPTMGSKGYTLPFSDRVKMTSVQNFMITQKDKKICEFGKITEDEFSLDFVSPLTPLAAFALALSSIDLKICCE